MKILSLFDGMACGYEALLKAGIKIDKYYASEIDKYAIKVATTNHPDIIEIGDVRNVKGEDYKDIDLLIGGSPCTGFSFAGKQLNFNDPQSKLFFEYLRILKEAKPKYFLLENVKMKKEYQDKITELLWGIEPVLIDSALLTAQRRKRNYWVGELQEDGTYKKVDIPQPKDRGVTLKDILLEKVDEKYILAQKQIDMIANGPNGFELVNVPCATQLGNSKNRGNSYGSDKAYTLRTCNPNGVIESVRPPKIRKLHPIECERLQGLRDGYTGVEGISDTQRYKMLGNGWTVDVIAHIFSFIR